MNLEKPIIFVSHAAVDAEIANIFKKDIEKSFLGLCTLFVSSNLDSLQGGKEWIQEIKSNLSRAVAFVGLLSPVALTRPWIYAEFGAGWIRGIPTISVCHSGLRKSELPVPLSHFQALDIDDEMHVEHLYDQISKAIGCQKPERDYKSDCEKYKHITEEKRKERDLRQWHSNIQRWNPDFPKIFLGTEQEILIPSEADGDFRNFVMEMSAERMIDFQPVGMAMGTRVGMQASVWKVKPDANFDRYKKSVEFR